MMYITAILLTIFGLGVEANAEYQNISKLEPFSGEVRCSEDVEIKDGCSLVLIESNGKTSKIESMPELEVAANQNPGQHLKVALLAERTPRFLFWGGKLKVAKFTIDGYEAEDLCSIASQKKNAVIEEFPARGEFRPRREKKYLN